MFIVIIMTHVCVPYNGKDKLPFMYPPHLNNQSIKYVCPLEQNVILYFVQSKLCCMTSTAEEAGIDPALYVTQGRHIANCRPCTAYCTPDIDTPQPK